MVEQGSRPVLASATFIFGVSLGLLSAVFHLPTSVTFIFLLITFGIPLSVFDIRQHRLPNALTGSLFFSSLGSAVTNSILRHEKIGRAHV